MWKKWVGYFFGCSNLETVDVSHFDTSKVTNMQSMFYKCSKLENIDVSGFDTSNAKNIGWLFYECNNLEAVDVSNFDTSKVTNMQSMFYNCSKLENVDVSGFDTSNVENMGWLFYGCSNLKEVNVSNFDTSKVTNMKSMFNNCGSLTSLDVSNFDTSKVTDISFMFYGCKGQDIINLTSFKTKADTLMEKMFKFCKGGVAIVIPKDMNINSNDIFEECSNPVIICDKNSPAQTFAKNNNVKYITSPTIEGIKNGKKYTNTLSPTAKYAEICNIKLIRGDKEVSGYKLGNEINTNGSYTIKAKYPVGEETVISFSVELPVSVSYSTTALTNKDVVVTITANTQIQEIKGWKLSKDKTKLTKTYSENGSEKVTVTDIGGNSTILNINVGNIDKTSPIIEGVKENKKQYKEVTPKAKDDNLKTVELYKDGKIVNTYKNGDKITEKGNYKIVAKDSAGNATEVNFVIVSYIPGDVNNDGKVTVTDLLLIKRSIVKLINLAEEQKMRGDINSDDKITVTDLLGVKRIILKLK